jgi:hypothetical protein
MRVVFLNLKPLVIMLLVSSSAFAAARTAASSTSKAVVSRSTDESKERSRLEDLFIWKTSEELKLAPADEQTFTDVIHDLNKRRHQANAHMDSALARLSSAKTKAETEKALAAHRAAVKEAQAVQIAELDRLKPLLGPEKLAKYIVTKNSILEKLKAMLAAPAPASATPSPAAAAK